MSHPVARELSDPMSPSHSIATDQLDDAERFALELRWYEGRMLLYVEWLHVFVERHRDEILKTAADSNDTTALLAATKQLIAQHGSIHMGGELNDQKRELEKELWYR